MSARLILYFTALLLLAACAASQFDPTPEPVKDFSLGHRIVQTNGGKQGPFSRPASQAGADPALGKLVQARPRPSARGETSVRAGSIENAEKIGISAGPSTGLSRMIDDIRLTDPAWFYTWTPTLPKFGINDWSVGDGVRLGGSETDPHIVLDRSRGAWIIQDVPVPAGSSYNLSLVTGGSADAAGGVSVIFRDSGGAKLSEHRLPLGPAGLATLGGLVAPAGTAQARISLWGQAGTLEVDDVRLLQTCKDVVRNGGFQTAPSGDISDIAPNHVPMIWGRQNVTAAHLAALSDAPVILGFNEPDHAEQSAMSVDEAVALWPKLMAGGARLGSPATTTPGTLGDASWLGRFMAQAEASDLRVDFVAVHYYSADKDVDAFETFLNKTYAAYRRPIWVTEWALVDWNWPDRFSADETARFFAEAVQMLDDLDFVERHAWFSLYDGMDGLNINTHLIDRTGALTPVGQAYADLAPDREILGTPRADRPAGGAGDDTLARQGRAAGPWCHPEACLPPCASRPRPSS